MSKFFVCVLVLFIIHLTLNLIADFVKWTNAKDKKTYLWHFADFGVDVLMLFAFMYLMGGMN